MIEKCLIFHMTKEECMEALTKHATIEPVITSTELIQRFPQMVLIVQPINMKLVMGMIAGHAYYFLEDVYPRMTGRRPLRTPSLSWK